ncbi:6165_t:CDS:2, partial [Dentiscutata heterogama]
DSDFDVKIIVGYGQNIKEFKAHSTILSSRSLYFQRALSERWNNKERDFYVFKKQNIYPYVFKIILDYIYEEKPILHASGKTSLDLLAASDELELLNLAERVQEHLIEKQSSWLFSNLIISLNFICYHDHFHKLYKFILNFICKNPYSLFNSKQFPLLDKVALMCLLKRDDLELEEKESWDYLIKWGIANSKKLLVENISNLSDEEDISNLSDEDITSWSDNQFEALKETISQCIPLIRYCHIQKNYIDKQIKQYRLDPTAFIKYNTSKLQIVLFFSFTDPSNPILSRVITKRNDKAIWSDKYHGPCFGNSDLCMTSDNWESVCTNYSCTIADLSQFAVEEYEVFAVYNFNSSKTATLKRIQ